MASCYINSLILFFHITQLELGFAKFNNNDSLSLIFSLYLYIYIYIYIYIILVYVIKSAFIHQNYNYIFN
jgi:hypothetical protein